jgi:acyl-CoA thioesterase-1
LVQRLAAALVIAVFAGGSVMAADKPVKIVALGDSLVAGYGLPANAAFPVQLEKALNAKGVAVEVANAGVSGDTSSGGLGRLDWSVPEGTEAVIVTLGANDMLRGLDPKVARDALTQIVQKLKARKIEVLLTGMQSAPNMGPDYARAFNAIYPDIAKSENVLLYPFYLDGIAGDAKLNQRDGIHPTEAGIAAIVQRVLPKAEELVARVKAKRGS